MDLIKCPACKKDVSSNAITCPNCGQPIDNNIVEKQKTEMLAKQKSSNQGCLIAIIVFIIIGIIAHYSAKEDSRKESQAFKDQLSKDPRQWTQEEKTRYNNFAEWQDKQQNK